MMQRMTTLPMQPLQVSVFKVSEIVPQERHSPWSNQPQIFHFRRLHETDQVTEFDPAQLTDNERNLALSRWQGQMVGIIAVPFGVVYQALQADEGKLYIELDGETYATSQMFDHFSGEMADPVVLGVYTGAPDVTAHRAAGAPES